MNSTELANVTADPIQILGMSFYFADATRARGKENGLNSFEYYGLGRGGTLGDVDADVIIEAFTFFHPRVLERMWTQAKEKADPAATAADYVRSAYAFADQTFGAVDVAVLRDFAAAAHKVAAAVESGHHQLVDGYKQYEVPTNPVHAAYLGCILMRELRGCVHIDAVHEVGLSALEACYLQDPAIFTMHGYVEEETPTVTPETAAKKVRAEELTTSLMAECFSVLSDDERQHLADGAVAMYAALASPVCVD
jgi:helix-turn-helix protein